MAVAALCPTLEAQRRSRLGVVRHFSEEIVAVAVGILLQLCSNHRVWLNWFRSLVAEGIRDLIQKAAVRILHGQENRNFRNWYQ